MIFILYINDIEKIKVSQLSGFFIGWKKTITPQQHYNILKNSTHFIIALEDDKAVGFITAVSDGVLSAFIPLIEVLPQYQGRGIGTVLMEQILVKLNNIPNIDLTCDADMQSFYGKFKMHKRLFINKLHNSFFRVVLGPAQRQKKCATNF